MQRRLLKSMRRMLWIFLWSTALYIPYFALSNGDWNIINWKAIRSFILLNWNPFGPHLWYILAYLYVLIVMLFVNRFRLWKLCFCLVPVLLLVNLVIGKYDVLIFNQNFDYRIARNFFSTGIPYFALGCLVKKHWNTLCSIKPKLVIIGMCLMIFILYLEYFLLKNFNLDSKGDIYFTTTFLALIVFLASLLIKQTKPNVWSKLGEEYSLYIYIFHVFIMFLLDVFNHKFMPAVWTDGIYQYSPVCCIGRHNCRNICFEESKDNKLNGDERRRASLCRMKYSD